MTDRLHIDIETFSESDLKAEGLFKYAEHPSTDLTVVCWALGDGPVNVWMPWKKIPLSLFDAIAPFMDEGGALVMGKCIPAMLEVALEEEDIAAHNAQFERVVLNSTAGKKHGVPEIRIVDTICTMAKCAVHGLPQALEHAANALGTYPKSKAGANEMRYFAKPRKNGTRATPYDEPKRYVSMVKYCIDDVKAERDLDNNIPDLSDRETLVYQLDQRINQRGVYVDIANVENANVLVNQYKAKLVKICETETGFRPSQTGKLADWIRENGYPQLPNLQAPTVVEALRSDNCPPQIKRILKLYSTHNMKAVTKFKAMARAVAADGRLHGMFQYYGAGPGRWSSRIVQLQNMLRPVIKNVDEAIDAMWLQDMDEVRATNPNVDLMKILASCTRGMLIAAPGRDLMSYDFAQIESRISAWLAGAEWKLKAFREDKIKIYNITGAMMFGVHHSQIVDDGENQMYSAAKVGELACGFQGWAGAIEEMARKQDMKLTIDPVDIASRWREANVEQVALWQQLDDAATWAVSHKGKAYCIPNKKIAFKVVGRWLYMLLPSRRKIAYLDPEIGKNKNGDECATYMGTNTYTRKWERVNGYGGRWLNNACEGIGRDLLVSGLLNMEEVGYKTNMTVHDEGVFEVDEDFGSDEEAMRLMTIPLRWADGLPVKCDGWRAKRYRK